MNAGITNPRKHGERSSKVECSVVTRETRDQYSSPTPMLWVSPADGRASRYARVGAAPTTLSTYPKGRGVHLKSGSSESSSLFVDTIPRWPIGLGIPLLTETR